MLIEEQNRSHKNELYGFYISHTFFLDIYDVYKMWSYKKRFKQFQSFSFHKRIPVPG